MSNYTAFILTPETREELLEQFPPAYADVKADHITHQFGVDDFGDLFHPGTIEVTGMVDDGNGLQALVVKVDGEQYRADGRPYHITWSLDPHGRVPEEFGKAGRYLSVHANGLVAFALDNPDGPYPFQPIEPSLEIKARPALVIKGPDGEKQVKDLPGPGFVPHPFMPSEP